MILLVIWYFASNLFVVRVSSAAIITDSFRILMARSVISSKLPIGVDKICNTDIVVRDPYSVSVLFTRGFYMLFYYCIMTR